VWTCITTESASAALKHLAGNINLEVVRLGQTDATDAAVAHLSRAVKLRELNISYTQSPMRACSSLEPIDASGAVGHLTLQGHRPRFGGTRNKPEFWVLTISGPDFTGEGLEALRGFAQV